MNDRTIRPGRIPAFVGACLIAVSAAAQNTAFDPRGAIHIPIGIAHTLDSLKTFVEPEGIFSPGVGVYGIYFRVYDGAAGNLLTPTMAGAGLKPALTP